MRLAALYDIHGNLPALEAVLTEVASASVDHVVIGGDVVPGPMPAECLDLLISLDVPTSFIRGNGDRETVAASRGQIGAAIPEPFRDSVRWNGAQLSSAHQRVIETWPLTLRMTVPEVGDVLFCHATPRDDNEIFTEGTAEEKLRPRFDPLGVDVVVCGHTHMQFDRIVGRTRVLNAGSVGMSFEGVGAYWLLIDPQIVLRRTEYDVAAAARRVRQTAYPLAEVFATSHVLTTPTAATMRRAFVAAELTGPIS